jgi:hypothetical protein
VTSVIRRSARSACSSSILMARRSMRTRQGCAAAGPRQRQLVRPAPHTDYGAVGISPKPQFSGGRTDDLEELPLAVSHPVHGPSEQVTRQVMELCPEVAVRDWETSAIGRCQRPGRRSCDAPSTWHRHQ